MTSQRICSFFQHCTQVEHIRTVGRGSTLWVHTACKVAHMCNLWRDLLFQWYFNLFLSTFNNHDLQFLTLVLLKLGRQGTEAWAEAREEGEQVGLQGREEQTGKDQPQRCKEHAGNKASLNVLHSVKIFLCENTFLFQIDFSGISSVTTFSIISFLSSS